MSAGARQGGGQAACAGGEPPRVAGRPLSSGGERGRQDRAAGRADGAGGCPGLQTGQERRSARPLTCPRAPSTCRPPARSQVLKQKRLYESQREQLYNQQFNVEQTAFAMESAKDSIQTVSALKVGRRSRKAGRRGGRLALQGAEEKGQLFCVPSLTLLSLAAGGVGVERGRRRQQGARPG